MIQELLVYFVNRGSYYTLITTAYNLQVFGSRILEPEVQAPLCNGRIHIFRHVINRCRMLMALGYLNLCRRTFRNSTV